MTKIVILVFFSVAFVFLQIFLSKKENKWLGIVLPIITFGFSLLAALSVATSDYYAQDIITVTIALLLFNIPTAVLLAIYASYRGKHKKQRALEKMSAQDLE